MGRTNQTDGNKPTAAGKKGKKKDLVESDESLKTKVNKDVHTEKRKHHWHPGTVAKRQMNKYQRGTELLLRKGPFKRLVREILDELREKDAPEEDPTRTKRAMYPILQEATEGYVINLFRKSTKASKHGKRVTLMSKDVRFVRDITEDGRISAAS